MPTEYKANATGLAQALADCPTAAFTYDDFSALYKELYKASPPPESSKYPLQHVNWGLVAKHHIRIWYDDIAGMYLMAPSEMRRAKECGAIWYEDRNGNRIP